MTACRKAQLECHPGLKKDDSSYLTDLRLYHNHVRLHLGLSDGQTPGEAAGIRIEGRTKRSRSFGRLPRPKSPHGTLFPSIQTTKQENLGNS